MGLGAKKRTVQAARDLLRKPKIAPVSWGTVHRCVAYGATAKAVRHNLVTVKFCGRSVAVHRKVVASLVRVESAIRAAEAKHGWVHWMPDDVSCFCWRKVRGGTTLSHHAQAVAIDIDSAANPMQTHFSAKQTMTIPVHVVQAFEDEGWTWGGSWTSPCDPQHFQYR